MLSVACVYVFVYVCDFVIQCAWGSIWGSEFVAEVVCLIRYVVNQDGFMCRFGWWPIGALLDFMSLHHTISGVYCSICLSIVYCLASGKLINVWHGQHRLIMLVLIEELRNFTYC